MELPNKFAAWLTVNRACNLRCGWCYARITNFSRKTSMSLDTVRKAIHLFEGLPLKNVILIGGEPTIHPNFLEIVKMIKKAGLRSLLITNGLRLADIEFLDKSLAAGINAITISVKGANDDEYQRFTGVRAFDKVMRAVTNVSIRKIPHKISITICKDLFFNFGEFIDVVSKSRADSFSLDMGRPMIANDRIIPDGIATPREMADFIIRIYPKLVACGKRFTIKFSIPLCLFPEDFIKIVVKNNQAISGCQIFNGKGIIIDPEGRLLPCNHFCNNPLGILGVDFSDAKGYYQFRNRPDVIKFYETVSSCPSERCVDCTYWQYCGAGCRVHWLFRESRELIGNFCKKGGESWTHKIY